MADEGAVRAADALARVLEIERGIEALRAEREVEADRLLEVARERAAAVRAGTVQRVREALERLGGEIARERDAALAEIEASAAAELARYDGIPEAVIRTLADWVAHEVAGGSES